MSYGIRVEAWGPYALFSRPEMKVERVSYDVITPSAARGLIEAVFWHPGMKWVIDRIHVLEPPRFTNIRRNEVEGKISHKAVQSAMEGKERENLYIATSNTIQQRASMVLKDVHYVIDAHFEMTEKAKDSDTPEKFYNMALRRLRNGQCFHQPCFGCREFPAAVQLYESASPPSVHPELCGIEKDLGYMLYDMDYSNVRDIKPMFFRAVLKNGVLDLAGCGVVQ